MLDLSPGGAVGAAAFAWCTLMALAPLRSPWALAVVSWVSGLAVSELPLAFLAVLVLSTAPPAFEGIRAPGGWIALAIAVLTAAGLVVVALRATRARPALERALDEALGSGWRDPAGDGLPRRSWWRAALAPFPVRPRRVVRTRDVAYADRGRATTLDLYRRRDRHDPAPTLVHLHGGHFRWGRKSREGRAMLHHLAERGWTCVSANYRLSPSPGEGFPGHLVDVKELLAWLHHHGPDHGVDPRCIVLSGSSSGAHLAAMAAVTQGDPRFQPGFETSDTSFAAGIGFYGYYGELGGPWGSASSPFGHDPSAAPPFLVVHGDHDTYTPIEGARALAAHLRTGSAPVVLAELPGAQHSFDIARSIRYDAVIDAVAAFGEWARVRASSDGADHHPRREHRR